MEKPGVGGAAEARVHDYLLTFQRREASDPCIALTKAVDRTEPQIINTRHSKHARLQLQVKVMHIRTTSLHTSLLSNLEKRTVLSLNVTEQNGFPPV